MKCLRSRLLLTGAICLSTIWVSRAAEAPSRSRPRERAVFEFADSTEVEQWGTVNDVIMGGLSTSRLDWGEDSTATFWGYVSLVHGGGFASIRTRPQHFDLGGYTGLRLRVNTDGKSYRFRVRDNAEFDGITYRVDIQTESDRWVELEFPFSAFAPSFRGRILDDADPLHPSEIQQMDVIIADGQKGPFRFQVDWIRAYRDSSASTD